MKITDIKFEELAGKSITSSASEDVDEIVSASISTFVGRDSLAIEGKSWDYGCLVAQADVTETDTEFLIEYTIDDENRWIKIKK